MTLFPPSMRWPRWTSVVARGIRGGRRFVALDAGRRLVDRGQGQQSALAVAVGDFNFRAASLLRRKAMSTLLVLSLATAGFIFPDRR